MRRELNHCRKHSVSSHYCRELICAAPHCDALEQVLHGRYSSRALPSCLSRCLPQSRPQGLQSSPSPCWPRRHCGVSVAPHESHIKMLAAVAACRSSPAGPRRPCGLLLRFDPLRRCGWVSSVRLPSAATRRDVRWTFLKGSASCRLCADGDGILVKKRGKTPCASRRIYRDPC